MQASHDAYCDENHTARQACNDALAPEHLREAAAEMREMAVELSQLDPVPESMRAEPPGEAMASSAVRDAVAMAEMPQPTPYVTREWERTAAAVARSERDAGEDGDAGGSRGPARSVLLVIMIALAMAVVARVLRRGARRGGAEDVIGD